MNASERFHSEYMTTEYDDQFDAVSEFGWYPWVGQYYYETGIFVVGMSTDKRDGGDWTEGISDQRDASRVLVASENDKNEMFDYSGKHMKSFKNMAHIFTNKAGLKWNSQETMATFWASVAFTNFFQIAVEDIGAIPSDDEVERAERVFHETLNIIEPKLVLVWSNDISFFIPGYRAGASKIGRVTPYVLEPKIQKTHAAPIVGMGHASRINQSACIDFLLEDSVSKNVITDFIAHLKQQRPTC